MDRERDGEGAFRQRLLQGRFSGILRWEQLDELWARILAEPEGWYVYQVGEAPPDAPLEAEALRRFVAEVDALLRREHGEDYCGIVYADDREHPTLVKIYDPNNLGSSCGSSGRFIPPRWVLSRVPPEAIEEPVTPMGRRRWWRRLWGG